MHTACNISKLALPMIACWLKWVRGHLNAVTAKWVLRSLLLFALQKETREVEPEMDEQSRRCAQCRCKVGISICNVCISTSQFGSVPYVNNTTGVSTMTCTLVSTPGIWWYSEHLGIVMTHSDSIMGPMNTQVINQPIVSETESLMKALYYHQGVSIANHTSSPLLWKAHASPSVTAVASIPSILLGGTAGLCVPPWRRGRSFSHAFKAFLAVWLGSMSAVLRGYSYLICVEWDR